MDLIDYLERLFGTRVDLGTAEDLRPRVRPYCREGTDPCRVTGACIWRTSSSTRIARSGTRRGWGTRSSSRLRWRTDATLRCPEVIGEAANHVPEKVRREAPSPGRRSPRSKIVSLTGTSACRVLSSRRSSRCTSLHCATQRSVCAPTPPCSLRSRATEVGPVPAPMLTPAVAPLRYPSPASSVRQTGSGSHRHDSGRARTRTPLPSESLFLDQQPAS